MTESTIDNNDENDKKEKQHHTIISDKDLPLCFMEDRHLESIEGIECITQTWRMKERMKTVSVALVLCLNVGVDPPDVVKTQPCARLECWIDPLALSASKSLEKIGANLQAQYERWQPRARYKQSLDPTADEVKKLCISLRRNAKEERVLFHYNGHGVPKPTYNGEIWVFNRTYTQYIPLSIYDLQTWMGAPSIYVYDCSNAGIIIESFEQFALQHEKEYETQILQQNKSQPSQSQQQQQQQLSPPQYRNCIQLAACSAKQVLPMNPDLPADLFTSCLTTPIKVALRWYVLQPTSKLVPKVTLDLIDKIPGQITDRRTMLGELNWIFTAITDTIAWNTLQRDLFQKLFRQDLLVASLFRNFLLAERILKSCDCTPISSPSLPSTSQHPMWNAWDLALDLSLGQLPGIVYRNEQFKHLPFFEEQLTAFQVWLELGCEERTPPEQLPIVLQVLLSQVHRMRALELLGKFLDLGPWAVNLALSVGIFPYVLKLLQSSAKELRTLLVFIWAKILAVDNFQTCQSDLVRDGGHKYFLSILQDMSLSSEYRMYAAFVLACIVNNYRDGQEAALQGSLVSICLEQLNDPNPKLRQWVAICLGKLWDNYEQARWTGVRDIAHEKLYSLLTDPCPEVRASSVYALGTFINSVTERSEHANNIDHSVVMTLIKTVSNDMSCLVRKELINALQWIVLSFEHVFVSVALKENQIGMAIQENITPTGMRRIGSRDRLRISEDSLTKMKRVSSSSSINNLGQTKSLSHTGSFGALPGLGYGSIYMKIWNSLCSFETDPHPDVANMCKTITKHIQNMVQEHLDVVDNKMNASLSLPPSPNRGNFLSGESPPTLHPSDRLQPSQQQQRSTLPTRSRKYHPTINEENDDNNKIKFGRKALINTKFVEWACKCFAQSAKKSKHFNDIESNQYYEKDWRLARNNNVRKEAQEECSRIFTSKLESQVFNTRTSIPPTILRFHPYNQQIAIGGRDHFGIWDWGTGAKTTVCHNKSLKLNQSKITSLEWINSHDIAMLMVGSDDGSIKVYKPNYGQSREPSLISAWQAINDIKKIQTPIILSWEQFTQTAIIGGDTKFIKFWDIERELHYYDIPTGTDKIVTCIDSTFSGINYENINYFLYNKDNDLLFNNDDDQDNGIYINDNKKTNSNDYLNYCNKLSKTGLVVVGCYDGSVRVYDRRCNPTDARIAVFMEHYGEVLGVQLLDNTFYSASTDGYVKVYDIRNHRVVHTTQTIQNNMSCFAMHRGTGTYACGSLNQNVTIYGFNGQILNTIRFYEGFMGHRTGPVTCLNYHPLRVALATGTSDSSVSVYCLETKR